MKIFKKAAGILNSKPVRADKAGPAQATKPRFESVLKSRTIACQGLRHQTPGITQSQEVLAKEWRKTNNLTLV